MTTSIASILRETPIVGPCISGIESAVTSMANFGFEQIPGAALCLGGGKMMLSSANMIAQGKLSDMPEHAVAGITAIEVGAGLNGFGHHKNDFVSMGVCTGALGVAFGGVRDLYRAARNGCKQGLLTGAAHVVGGGLVLASAIKAGAESTAIVTQGIAIGSMCAKIAYLGALNLRQGKYLSGLGKIALGLTGAAAIGYICYQALGLDTGAAREIRLATVYDNKDNPNRQSVSDLGTSNHRKYAEHHGLKHDVVSESLVEGQCSNPITKETADCSPYWNKIKYFKNWCEAPPKPGTEEWAIYADDDAVYTNFNIDPSTAIDQLRGKKDTSFIIATEGRGTRFSPGAANSGVLIVRKDPKGCGVIDRIWANRNVITSATNENCPTYGLCKDQSNGDEQGAADKVFYRDAPWVIGKDVTRVLSRDPTHPVRGGIAFNTLHRGGCFRAMRSDGALHGPHNIMPHDLSTNPDGIWQEGDWIGQTGGYPLIGQDLSHQDPNHCTEDASIPIEPIRLKKLAQMVEAADRSLFRDPRTPIDPAKRPNLTRGQDIQQSSFYQRVNTTKPKHLSLKSGQREITFGAVYDNGGDPNRQPISDFVNANHEKYAKKWGMKHQIISRNLVAGRCTHPATGQAADCAPYWNKIQMLRDWLNEPKKPGVEEWRYYADDDMLVMNMLKDPSKAIDQLRGDQDTSVIVSEDVIDWQGWFFEDNDPHLSVNTGVLIVRKDEEARKFIDRIWRLRDAPPVKVDTDLCPTIGMCKLQSMSMQEQEAMTMLLKQNPDAVGDVITIVPPRDSSSETRADLGMNTFYRKGCFTRKQKDWAIEAFSYEESDAAQNPSGAFQKGDWLVQVAGVPVLGKELPFTLGSCIDDPEVPEGPVRLNKLKKLAEEIVE